MASLVPSGSRIAFKLNGVKVALADSLSFDHTYTMIPVTVLDQPDVVEFVDAGYDVSFSATKFVLATESLKSLGIEPTLSALLERPELEAEFYDRITSKSLYKYIGVKLSGNSGNVAARDIFKETLTFVARKALDFQGN